MPENQSSNPVQPDIVYDIACVGESGLCFAARSTGLFRSTDGGVSWESAYTALQLQGPLPTTSVVVSPDFAEDHSVFAGVAGGVMTSTDEGRTWSAVMLATPPPAVSMLVISPAFREDAVLLASSTADGIFRCANRGAAWSRWNFGLLDLHVLCMAISPAYAHDETIYAGVETGIFRSTNGGRAWREVDLPIGFEPVVSLAVSPAYAQDGTVFAGTETQSVLRSQDRGKTWQRLGEDIITAPVNKIILSPTYTEHPDVLVLVEDALFLSRDAGVSWQPLRTGASDLTTVTAPQGLGPRALLLLGTAQGQVVRSELEPA